MTAPSTEHRASFRRMRRWGATPTFQSDVATVSSFSVAAGFPLANLLAFSDLSLGDAYRSTSAAAGEYLEWDFGAAVSLGWAHLAGVRGVLPAASFAAPTTVELYAGAAPNPAGLVGAFRANPANGDLWLTFESVAAARYWRIRFNGSTSGLGYYEIRRAALDAYETFPTNFRTGFRQSPGPRSVTLENSWGQIAVRHQAPRPRFTCDFQFVGSAATDLEIWRQFLSWGSEPLRDQAPEVPFWFAPDPTGVITGANADRFAPRFSWLSRVPDEARDARTGEDLFSLSIELSTVL